MGRTIVATAGWAGIVALGWRLAQLRIIALCQHDVPCYHDHQATKDNIIIGGLTVALRLHPDLPVRLSRHTGAADQPP